MRPHSLSHEEYFDTLSSKCVLATFSPVRYVLDYRTRQFIHVDDSCIEVFGISSTQWKNEGFDGYMTRWHPHDRQVATSIIFPYNMQFLAKIQAYDFQNFIFSFNYRVKTPRGDYLKILERSSFIPLPDKNEPVRIVSLAFDFTHYYADDSIVYTIEQIMEQGDNLQNRLVNKETFNQCNNPKLLTMREIQILDLISQGLTSKEIATALQVSTNTINNHRKNMLAKTECTSSAQLIQFGFKLGHIPRSVHHIF